MYIQLLTDANKEKSYQCFEGGYYSTTIDGLAVNFYFH